MSVGGERGALAADWSMQNCKDGIQILIWAKATGQKDIFYYCGTRVRIYYSVLIVVKAQKRKEKGGPVTLMRASN